MKSTLALVTALLLAPFSAMLAADPVSTVTGTPGLVAFWAFVKREPSGQQRFNAHVRAGATNDYPLEAANYIKDYWGAGRQATYADFPQLGRGPFGSAIRIVKETDPDFRPFLFVPRSRLIVTTNLPFENWTEVLGSERLTGAALDRLTHRCHILETKGESYRLQDAKRRRRTG